MDETSLVEMFGEYGTLLDLTVIRDRVTNMHKGCAFVVFADRSSAQHCVDCLHEKVKLPNVSLSPLYFRCHDLMRVVIDWYRPRIFYRFVLRKIALTKKTECSWEC